jgi:hypothetical protein
LALLLNSSPFVSIANKKFKDFENFRGNLGSSTTFDLPPRMTSAKGLVASFQPASQRALTLSCDQASNTSYEFTAQERIFNVEKEVDSYIAEFGESANAELSTEVEATVALNCASAMPVNTVVNAQTVPTGALHTESGPYRFFGDGTTALNSFTQLAQMITNFKNYGAVKSGIKVVLPDTIIPSIVGTGLTQFATERNNEIANSWQIGTFGTPPVDYYTSNLLPIHVAGNVGEDAKTLTVISTDDPTGANITAITFSGASASDDDAFKAGDLLEFKDGVSGKPNMRFLTFIGHKPSQQPVQVRILEDAESNGSGHVTVSIFPALQSTAGATQNLNNNIVAGMQATVLPSHTAGVVIGGGGFFLSMPQLPDQNPYATSNMIDKDTGVSMRMTYGSVFGQNQQGMIHDVTFGAVMVPEYTMRVIIPL